MMKRYIKRIVPLCILVLLILPLTAMGVEAQVSESSVDFNKVFGTQEAIDAMPSTAKNTIGDAATSGTALSALLSPGKVLDFILGGTITIVKQSVRDLGIMLAVVLLFSVLSALVEASGRSEVLPAFNIAALLCLSLTVFGCVKSVYNDAYTAILDLSVYVKALMPVMAGMLAATGAVASSAILPVVILAVLEVFSGLNTSVMLPMINVYFAICLAGAISDKVSISGIAGFIKSGLLWCMTGLTTILVGVLSLQGIVAGSADNLAGRAAKFAVGSFVPVVGGIVKDALDTMVGSIGVIKTVAGTAGIVGIFITLCPVLVRLLVYMLIFKIAAAFAQIGAKGQVSDFLLSVSNIWNMVFAVTTCQGVILVTAVAVLLAAGGGG